jgi:riboflavin synthase
MFTGIITEVGSIRSVERVGAAMNLEIECHYEALVLGESIAVDGTCLTAARITRDGFVANASAETLARTTLSNARSGHRVNLERALAVGDRLGGHIVAGHVDGIGQVAGREPVSGSERWTITAPPEVLRFVAEKGSVTVDGVSLTINAVGPTTFEVNLVPFTLGATALGGKHVGSPVNLEADVIARYVARALEARAPGGGGSGGVTMELLQRAGFTGT